jgi:DNA polymerase-3 subunit epsilon
MIDPNASIDETPFAVLDFETTGLSPNLGDRVCEVAILRCRLGEITDRFETLIYPQRPVGRGAYAVHHISDDELSEAPIFAEVADQVLALLDDAVLVAHNAPFDLSFVASELGHMGLPMPRLVALDTLALARSLYPMGSYSLGNLCRVLGIETDQSEHRAREHRAMADVALTWGLFQHITDNLWRRGERRLRDLLLRQGGAIRYERPEPLELPPALAEALQNRCQLRLLYRSESGQETERLVRPLDVTRRGRTVVLLAHCLLRGEQRTFRLDRILRMDVVEPLE